MILSLAFALALQQQADLLVSCKDFSEICSSLRCFSVTIRRSRIGFLGLCGEAGGSFVDEPKQSTKQRPSRGAAIA
jgi:hypothetical protein